VVKQQASCFCKQADNNKRCLLVVIQQTNNIQTNCKFRAKNGEFRAKIKIFEKIFSSQAIG